MCFNALITWGTAALGFGVSGIALAKNKSRHLYLPPVYFALMEVIQGLMYTQLGHPSDTYISVLVYLAYVHVCFQPFMINYWLGAFIPPDKKQLYLFTLKLCFIGALLLLSRVYFTAGAPLCSSFETLCSKTPLVYYGLHHIAWSLPLEGAGWHYITPSIALHFFLFFIPGLLLGFYRLMLVFFILGPYLAAQITPNVSEQSSIWCIIGLWMLCLTTYTSLIRLPHFFIPKTNS